MNVTEHLLVVFEEELLELSVSIQSLNIFGGEQDPQLLAAVSVEWNDVLAVASKLSEIDIAVRVDLNHSPIPCPRVNTSPGQIALDISLGILDLAKTISKTLRFGLTEQRDLLSSNKERIELGWLKIVGMIGGLTQLGVNLAPNISSIMSKQNKLAKYTRYSEDLGVLLDNALYPTSEYHEDDGNVLFVSFSRNDKGIVLGEPPLFHMGYGYLEEDFDENQWTHFIKGSSLNYIFDSVWASEGRKSA